MAILQTHIIKWGFLLNVTFLPSQTNRASQIKLSMHPSIWKLCDPNVLKKTHMHQHTMINDSARAILISQPLKPLGPWGSRLCFTAFFALFWPRTALGTKNKHSIRAAWAGCKWWLSVSQREPIQNEWLTYWNVFLCFGAALTWQIGGLRQSAFLITHTYVYIQPTNQRTNEPLCDAKWYRGGGTMGRARCRWHCVDGERRVQLHRHLGALAHCGPPRLFEKALILLGKHNRAGCRWKLWSIYS